MNDFKKSTSKKEIVDKLDKDEKSSLPGGEIRKNSFLQNDEKSDEENIS